MINLQQKLRKGSRRTRRRQEILQRLRSGPWFWPSVEELTPDLREELPSTSTQPGPVPAPPGRVLLVSQRPAAAELWVYDPYAAYDSFGIGPNHPDAVPLGQDVHRVWDDAAEAVYSGFLRLTIPQRRILGRDHVHWKAWRAVARPADEGSSAAPPLPPVLRGRSLGVALALAMVSRHLEHPLPGTLLASATLDATGRLGPVDGLRSKLAVAVHEMPNLKLVIVADDADRDSPGGAAEARKILDDLNRSDIEVLGAATLGKVLLDKRVFGPDLFDRLWRRHLDELRAELDAHGGLGHILFATAMDARQHGSSWQSLARATAAVLAEPGHAKSPERAKVEFASMVAHRHTGEHHLAKPPDDLQWYRSLPDPLQAEVLAHYLQNAHDHGSPTLEAAEKLFVQHAIPSDSLAKGSLKCFGAFGRLLAIRGRPEEALKWQQKAAEGWISTLEWLELSYPLCEILRLSGLLGDGDSLRWALRQWSLWEHYISPLDNSHQYVLAASRAGLLHYGELLGPGEVCAEFDTKIRALLDRLRRAPFSLGTGLLRRAVRMASINEAWEFSVESPEIKGWLDPECGAAPAPPIADPHLALARADVHLAAGRPAAARSALQQMPDGAKQLVAHLTESCPKNEELVRWITRHFPYYH